MQLLQLFNKKTARTPGSVEKGEKKLNRLRALKLLIMLVLVLLLVFRFMLGVSIISGNSMYPALENNQPVLYSRIFITPQRGDVVSVRMPSGEYVIKRVIALAGDTLEVREGNVYINGKIEAASYVNGRTYLQDGTEELSITVPEGFIYVMGDNREVSVDSRTYGVISLEQIRGKLFSAD